MVAVEVADWSVPGLVLAFWPCDVCYDCPCESYEIVRDGHGIPRENGAT